MRQLATILKYDAKLPEVEMLQFVENKLLIPRRNNLPLEMTSFIGRECEITGIKHLLAASRLVTPTRRLAASAARPGRSTFNLNSLAINAGYKMHSAQTRNMLSRKNRDI